MVESGGVEGVVAGVVGEALPLLFGHGQVDDLAVEPGLNAGEAGGAADAGEAIAGGGVSGECADECVDADRVGVDSGPCSGGRRLRLPGERFVDVVPMQQVSGLVTNELTDWW